MSVILLILYLAVNFFDKESQYFQNFKNYYENNLKKSCFLGRHRMKGESVIWVPGLDHAGIATQAIVEKYLAKTKRVDRYELGKEEFLSSIEEWKEEKSKTIKNQLRVMGSSLDWSKEFFTMSKVNFSVFHLFIFSAKSTIFRPTDRNIAKR